MGFQTQSGDDFLYALTFAIIYGLAFAAAWALYSLGSLPGRIARSRRHPNATAIGVCGWLGLPLVVLWPIALAWAYTPPRQRRRRRPIEKEAPRTSGSAARSMPQRLACARQTWMLWRRACAKRPSKSPRSKAACALIRRNKLPSAGDPARPDNAQRHRLRHRSCPCKLTPAEAKRRISRRCLNPNNTTGDARQEAPSFGYGEN